MDLTLTTTTNHASVSGALRILSDGLLELAAALESDRLRRAGIARVQGPTSAEAPEPTPEPKHAPILSYSSGAELGRDGIHKREAAQRRGQSHGYDYAHWARMVRRLRVDILSTSCERFAKMVGVSVSSIHNWETGTCFPTQPRILRLEAVACGIIGWTREDWRTPQPGAPPLTPG